MKPINVMRWFALLLVVINLVGCSARLDQPEPERNPLENVKAPGTEPTKTDKSPASEKVSSAKTKTPEIRAREADSHVVQRPPMDQPKGSAARAPKGQDWTMTVQDNGSVLIRCKGALIVSASYPFWGERWTWANPNFRAGQPTADGIPFESELKPLHGRVEGLARESGPESIRYEFRMSFSESLSNVVGGGIEWNLKLDSPVFDVTPASPVLLPENSGWSWQVGDSPEETITVRFDLPVAKVFFERNQKSKIRTFFVADSVEAGLKTIRLTVTLPKGGRITPSDSQRYGTSAPESWYREALSWNGSPVDLSFLNKKDRPEGKLGPIRVQGDRLVHADGKPARLWGSNLPAYALFSTPRDEVPKQARRMAQLGFNLMRIHHHDSPWVQPNVFIKGADNTTSLNPKAVDALDYWIKCLRDEGIYVWIDLHVQRSLRKGDPVSRGMEEILSLHRGDLKGFNYFNDDIKDLMRRFQEAYLGHVNPYTNLAYKDDPALVAVLLTNENDVTHHFGNMMLPDHKNVVHSGIFSREVKAFAESTGLSSDRIAQTWRPGPSKIFLNAIEHRFNKTMIEDLREQGVKAAIATTSYWGDEWLSSLPSLTDGDIIDAHSYGRPNSLEVNSRYQANWISWIAAARVYGKPFAITEWSVEYPHADRFVAPLYLASIASLQEWDAPMQYCYSQSGIQRPTKFERFETWMDPAYATMPAAALIYRLGYVSPGKESYCLMLDRASLFDRELSPETSATIRTLSERSKLTIGMPSIKELPWLKASEPSSADKVITDPDHDFLPRDSDVYTSDTGEIERNWKLGIQKINAPKAQAVSGWIGGVTHTLRDTSIHVDAPKKASVVLTSVDDQPLSTSRLILITAIARSQPSLVDGKEKAPMLSEPVAATITLKTELPNLQLLALGSNGRVVSRTTPRKSSEGLEIKIPSDRGTHWFVLKSVE